MHGGGRREEEEERRKEEGGRRKKEGGRIRGIEWVLMRASLVTRRKLVYHFKKLILNQSAFQKKKVPGCL